jgi:hypothetical protein
MSTFVLHRLVTVGGDFDIEAARAAAHAVIATLPPDQLRAVGVTDDPDADDDTLRRAAIQVADADLDAFASSIEDGDVDTIDLGPLVIYVSAGISYGDAPTDAAAAWEQLLDAKPWSPAVRDALGILDPATVRVTLPGIRRDGLDPALVALADAVADRHRLPTATITAAMLRLDSDPQQLWDRLGGPAVDALDDALFTDDAARADCVICGGRRWLHILTNSDDSRYWIERCDECSMADLTDDEAAEIAARETGYPVGWAIPVNCDHEHPFLAGVPDESIARDPVPPARTP